MQFPQSTVAICWSLFFSVSNNAYVSCVSTNFNLIYYIIMYHITGLVGDSPIFYTHSCTKHCDVAPARSAMKSTQRLARLEKAVPCRISLGAAEWAF